VLQVVAPVSWLMPYMMLLLFALMLLMLLMVWQRRQPARD
jgi:hypothetical protein